jgi:DNA primase
MVVPSADLKKLLGENAESYHRQLTGSLGEKYLVEERGLSLETIRYCRLGFVETPEPGDDMFRNRISIPFITPSGVVAIQYRAIDDSEKRFLNHGSTKRIWNTRTLVSPVRTVYMTEGLIDGATIHQLGLPVVGMPGVKSWDKLFARAFRNRRVIVCVDGDDNGQSERFASEVLTSIEDGGTILFEGTDVNQFYIDHGPEALRQKLGVNHK